LLGLALGEAFKQFVPDGDQDIRWDRSSSLLALLFMIFPFFHGMSQYFYTTYMLHPDSKLGPVAGRVMFDGMVFMAEAALFFLLSRSLSPSHWVRFYFSLHALLAVDSVWIGVSISYKAPLQSWLILNFILAVILTFVLIKYSPRAPYSATNPAPFAPSWICAAATLATTIASYVCMKDFYFP
jgi:uncharacterized protein with PQ loop repeat